MTHTDMRAAVVAQPDVLILGGTTAAVSEAIARKTLDRYANDWRGPLAHHARAVLAKP